MKHVEVFYDDGRWWVSIEDDDDDATILSEHEDEIEACDAGVHAARVRGLECRIIPHFDNG